jgi:hypothetical protein
MPKQHLGFFSHYEMTCLTSAANSVEQASGPLPLVGVIIKHRCCAAACSGRDRGGGDPPTPHPTWGDVPDHPRFRSRLITNKLAFFDITKRNPYEGQATAVVLLRSSRLKTCRGTELLDELANILPNLYSFDKDNDLEFASTILLLNRYWDNLRERTDNNSELRSEFIRILHKMAILYGEVNIPVACGARVIACDVESSCLNDEEAQLVHCITGIHIDLATSIVQAKSTEV